MWSSASPGVIVKHTYIRLVPLSLVADPILALRSCCLYERNMFMRTGKNKVKGTKHS